MWGAPEQKATASQTRFSGRRVVAHSVLKTGQTSFLLARRATARPVSKSVVSRPYREMLEIGQEAGGLIIERMEAIAGHHSGLPSYHLVANTRTIQNSMIARMIGSGADNKPVSRTASGKAVAPGPVNKEPAAMK